MRRIFGSRPTRFERGDAVRLKTTHSNGGLEPGMIGTIAEVRRTKVPSYDVQFINTSVVVGRFVVDEDDLMPADGRKFDDNDVVRLRRDVPSEGLATGTVGIVSEVSSGPPIRYVVEFVNASGAVTARTTLLDDDLSSPDEAPAQGAGTTGAPPAGPEDTGLADNELDQLIAERRSQGQAMQEQPAQERATQEHASQARAEAAEQRPEETPNGQPEPPAQPAEPTEPPVGQPAGAAQAPAAPPQDGRRTKFVKGETVRLETDLPSVGFEAGAGGTVTWAILGPPVSYLVEFRNAAGGTSPRRRRRRRTSRTSGSLAWA